MSAPLQIDTPDNTLGVVSPQVVLATVPAGTASVTVTIPPNAESIIVTSLDWPGSLDVTCVGVTTGLGYAGAAVSESGATLSSPTVFFDVSNVLDEQVLITWSPTPGQPWYVYADAGVHLVGDPTKRVNAQQLQYVVPSAPGPISNDHPPNEISVHGGTANSNGVLLGVPPGSQYWRVFAVQLTALGAWTAQIVLSSGQWLCACPPGGSGTITFPLTGIPTAPDTSINLFTTTGNAIAWVIAATVETL